MKTFLILLAVAVLAVGILLVGVWLAICACGPSASEATNANASPAGRR